MPIPTIANPGEAVQLISDFSRDHGAALSTEAWAALSAFYPSPVERVERAAEALYSAAKQLPAGDAQAAAASVCVQLADLCVMWQWRLLGQTERGLVMAGACRRIAGEGAQDEGLDPDVLPEFEP